jgi:hypothetical protein
MLVQHQDDAENLHHAIFARFSAAEWCDHQLAAGGEPCTTMKPSL